MEGLGIKDGELLGIGVEGKIDGDGVVAVVGNKLEMSVVGIIEEMELV